MPFVVFHHNIDPERWAAITRILERYRDKPMDERGVKRVLETDGHEWGVEGLASYLQDPSSQQSSLESLDSFVSVDFEGSGDGSREGRGKRSVNLISSIPSSIIKEQILPRMAALALELPTLFREPFPLLLAGRNGSLTFSQKQIACLVANAFFGTLVDQKKQFDHGSSTRKFPHCDFRLLFQAWLYNSVTKAKLDGIFEYFNLILDRPHWEATKITFTRRCLGEHEYPDWESLSTGFCDMRVETTGKIEDEGTGCLMADFANEFIGGGVLGQGAVQEEILFIIYPEMLASLLFCQQMMDNEAIFISGPERFSRYTGYASTFAISRRFNDATPFDLKGRRQTEFVAMDATFFRWNNRKSQFGKESILRELNKAYTSFLVSHQSPLPGDSAIATGNW
ncbi:UNVERIFIED_CONTAM: hypothetical protein HDU68_009493, partial [Siphonaria sp. JEL0065]